MNKPFFLYLIIRRFHLLEIIVLKKFIRDEKIINNLHKPKNTLSNFFNSNSLKLSEINVVVSNFVFYEARETKHQTNSCLICQPKALRINKG